MKNTQKKMQLSLMMFIQYFIWGSWYVVMGTYLRETLNFSGQQIGFAYLTAAIASIVSPFIVGMIADRYFSANRVMAFLNIIGSFLLIWISKIESPNLFLGILLLYTICYMPTTALANSISLDNLDNPEGEFSRVRLLGSIGWIVAGLLVSFLKIEHLSSPFLIAAGISIFGFFMALMLPYKAPVKKKEKETFFQILGSDALGLFKKKSFSLILIFSALGCIPLGFYDSFTNMFMNNLNLAYPAAAMSSGQAAEIVFLFTFPFFFSKLGYKKSFSAAMIAWVFLYGLFTLGSSTGLSELIYIALPLHGFCFTFFFVTGQLYVDAQAPRNLRNSAQGLIAFATYGVGKGMGAIISGKVVDINTLSDGSFNWVYIWGVPLIMMIIILVSFLMLFKNGESSKI